MAEVWVCWSDDGVGRKEGRDDLRIEAMQPLVLVENDDDAAVESAVHRRTLAAELLVSL